MFREMRRINQLLSQDESIAVLNRGTSGVLAVSGDSDYPYAVPLSYVYHNGKIFFHCAKAGHKLDSIERNEKVSFCVIDKDEIIEEEYTTYFRSIIAFGKATIITDDTEKRNAFEILAEKYSPNHKRGRLEEIDKLFKVVCIIELSIDYLSGKEAIELVRNK